MDKPRNESNLQIPSPKNARFRQKKRVGARNIFAFDAAFYRFCGILCSQVVVCKVLGFLGRQKEKPPVLLP
jgi:hypothetical protein